MRKKLLYYVVMFGLALSFFSCSSGSKNTSVNKDTIITADAIIKKLKVWKQLQPIVVRDKHVVGFLAFVKAGYPNKTLSISPIYIDKDITFINCVFEDSVSAYHVNPENKSVVYTVFEKNVTFNSCTFKKGVNFMQSDFQTRFSFDVCKVEGQADFSGCSFRLGNSFVQTGFDDDVLFVSTTFIGRCNFFKVLFKKTACFQYCRFNDISMFTDGYFYGYTEFSKIFSSAVLDFTNVKFSGRTLFCNSLFLSNIKLAKCVFKNDFSFTGNSVFGELNLKQAEIQQKTIFRDNSFSKQPETTDLKKGKDFASEDFGNVIVPVSKINVINLKK